MNIFTLSPPNILSTTLYRVLKSGGMITWFNVKKSWFFRKFKVFTSLYFNYTERELAMRRFMHFLKTSNIEGDYLEFGVFRGKTFVNAYHIAKSFGLNMKFYAFDSFEGLPTPEAADKDFDAFFEREFACDLESFKSILKNKGVSLSDCEFIPGWFDASLTKETKARLPIKKAALVYVDCDLYKSTVPILDFIPEYLQTGTILAFDDWFAFAGSPLHGEQKAVSEWLHKHPDITLVEYGDISVAGKAFIVQRQEK